MSILHELGHAFLELNEMETGATVTYGGDSKYETAAWLFARTLAMPREKFIEVLTENGYNIHKTALAYKFCNEKVWEGEAGKEVSLAGFGIFRLL